MYNSTDRSSVSVKDIMNLKGEELSSAEKAILPKDSYSYRPELYRSLELPSQVHGYSLAIEYMKYWFLDQFPKNFFKTVHINGKHVLDDWKYLNKQQVKREKPMLAIIPSVDWDYDRDQIDQYQADKNIYLKRSDCQQSFLKDYENNQFLYMQMRALRMNFVFKVRVNTRAEQVDLFNKMEMWFRIGATQYHRTSVDFHVPYDIIANIAQSVGFDLVNGRIQKKDILDLLDYLNKHSDLPFIYKMRAINQHEEFFIRIKGLYTHINTINKLELDDGERIGKLDENFHIEMNCVLTIPIPHFYVYMNQKPIMSYFDLGLEPDTVGRAIYSINKLDIDQENEYGWGLLAYTEYCASKGEEFLDIGFMFKDKTNVDRVIRDSIKNGLDPQQYIQIKLFRGNDIEKYLNCTMDWSDYTLRFDRELEDEEGLIIAVYADKIHINNRIMDIEVQDRENGRIKNDNSQDTEIK